MHQKVTISPTEQDIYTTLSVPANTELLVQNHSKNIDIRVWDGSAGTTADTAYHILGPRDVRVFVGAQLTMWTMGGEADIQTQLNE